MSPVVLNLTGWSRTGKTHLLERFRDGNPGSIQLLTPSRLGEEFDLRAVDWDGYAAVALDEVLMWERASMATAVVALEAYAEQHGKKVILVTQGSDDLSHNGIQLSTEPLTVRLEGRQQPIQPIRLSYDGNQLHWSMPAE